jgi:hypothetical protein
VSVSAPACPIYEWKRNVRYALGYSAHLFADGRALCHFVGTGSSPVDHANAPTNRYGVPYGRVCDACHRKWEALGLDGGPR